MHVVWLAGAKVVCLLGHGAYATRRVVLAGAVAVFGMVLSYCGGNVFAAQRCGGAKNNGENVLILLYALHYNGQVLTQGG